MVNQPRSTPPTAVAVSVANASLCSCYDSASARLYGFSIETGGRQPVQYRLNSGFARRLPAAKARNNFVLWRTTTKSNDAGTRSAILKGIVQRCEVDAKSAAIAALSGTTAAQPGVTGGLESATGAQSGLTLTKIRIEGLGTDGKGWRKTKLWIRQDAGLGGEECLG